MRRVAFAHGTFLGEKALHVESAGTKVVTTAIQCPNCRTRFKVRNLSDLDGKKVRCKQCSAEFRIRVPKAKSAPSADDEFDFGGEPLEDGAAIDDEFRDLADAPLPSALPGPAGRGPKKNASTGTGKQTFKEKPAGIGKRATGDAKRVVAIVSAVAAGLLMLIGIGVGGAYVLKNAGKGQKWEPPADKEYVQFAPDNFALSCLIPQSWKQSFGGGTMGAPAWCRFEDGTITIEARESISGGAIGQAAIAMSNSNDPLRKPLISPAQSLHEQQQRGFAEDYHDFQEQPSRPIQTGFGEGRISDFTAAEGTFHSKIKGCRATFLNSIRQFTVTCKCSPAVFKTAKPVFEKVVSSMGGGRGQ